ncbi:MAG: hypothetical protein QOJ44_1436, partial [Acidimicrobiaceae bacterium]|nr:hypothetical protein [Acidimicrobiaceae bacterium]
MSAPHEVDAVETVREGNRPSGAAFAPRAPWAPRWGLQILHRRSELGQQPGAAPGTSVTRAGNHGDVSPSTSASRSSWGPWRQVGQRSRHRHDKPRNREGHAMARRDARNTHRCGGYRLWARVMAVAAPVTLLAGALGVGTSILGSNSAGASTIWSIIATQNASPSQSNILDGVTCVTSSDCWAVGYARTGSAYQTLAEHRDGSAWSIIATQNTSPSQSNVLNGVTCVTSSDCWAVGYAATGTDGDSQTLAEHWDGSAWSIVATQNTSPSQSNALYEVTCVTSSDYWAVGFATTGTGGANQTLAERGMPAPSNTGYWEVASDG